MGIWLNDITRDVSKILTLNLKIDNLDGNLCELEEKQMDNYFDSVQNVIAMSLYMACVIGIGLYYAKRANSSSDEYFLGGRSLGPFVTAMSAEASDMSGWLLMGLPGVAYWTGMSEAIWIALGLATGTYLNWLITAKRLRVYSHVAGDAITLPDFFSNRFKENKKVIMTISSLFILIFFTVYASSCFVTVGKLFSALFNTSYVSMMIIGAVFVLAYTFIGGFLAESASDLMQAIVMIIALVTVLSLGLVHAGGIHEVVENAKRIPGFFEFFGIATPVLDESGKQLVENGLPLFGDRANYHWLSAASNMAWGLGYFGVPQVLIRFMAIDDPKNLKVARQSATIWCVISLIAAVAIGMIGRVLFPTALLTKFESENIFVIMAQGLMSPFIAGLVMAGILAATISSADSYLLIAASAVSKNLYQGILKQNATDEQVMKLSRWTLIGITLFGIFLALDEQSIIFSIVSFAWAGFGATFGPLILFSLFSKNVTHQGAVAGMVTGALTVFIWNIFIKPFGGLFAIYELLPAFIVSSLVIYLVSRLTPQRTDVLKQHEQYLKEYNAL